MRLYDVVDRSTLIADGLSSNKIQRNVRRGIWQRDRSGLYVVGPGDPEEPWRQRLALEIVWCGPNAMVSHRSAAFLHHFDNSRTEWRDVSVPRESIRRGAHIHRIDPFPESMIVSGLPVVRPEICLLQLGRYLDVDGVEVALESALRRGLVTIESLREAMMGPSGRTEGAPVLRAALARRPIGAPPTGSFLETQFVQTERNAHLPPMQRQVEIRDDRGNLVGRVDFGEVDLRLAVECDGNEFHGPEQLEADRRRQNAIELLGWRFARFTYSQIMRDRSYVVSVLRSWRRLAA